MLGVKPGPGHRKQCRVASRNLKGENRGLPLACGGNQGEWTHRGRGDAGGIAIVSIAKRVDGKGLYGGEEGWVTEIFHLYNEKMGTKEKIRDLPSSRCGRLNGRKKGIR